MVIILDENEIFRLMFYLSYFIMSSHNGEQNLFIFAAINGAIINIKFEEQFCTLSRGSSGPRQRLENDL